MWSRDDARRSHRGRRVASRPGVEPLEQRHVPSTGIGLPLHVLVVNERDGEIAIPIRRQGTSSGAEVGGQVTLVTSDGTAEAGVNYTATQQVVTINPGTLGGYPTVVVPILDDHVVGGPKTFQVSLVDPTGDLVLGGSSTVVRIVDASDLGPPTLQDVRLLAPGRNINGIVLTFSEPMDPAGVGDVGNYFLYGPMREGDSYFLDGSSRLIPLRSASYDPATNSVTLTPAKHLRPSISYSISNYAPGEYEPRATFDDPGGYPLDFQESRNESGPGGFGFTFARGKTLTFREVTEMSTSVNYVGRTTLSLTGGGTLESFDGNIGGFRRQVRLVGPRPGRSILSGQVRGSGGPTTQFDVIMSPRPFINRLKSPRFQVGQVIVGK